MQIYAQKYQICKNIQNMFADFKSRLYESNSSYLDINLITLKKYAKLLTSELPT